MDSVECRPADSVVILRGGQHLDLVGHFNHAARSLHGHLRIRLEPPFEAVAGEVDDTTIDSEHDVVEHSVVRQTLEHVPDRLLRFPLATRSASERPPALRLRQATPGRPGSGVVREGTRSSFILLRTSDLHEASVARSDWTTRVSADLLDDGVDRYQGVRSGRRVGATATDTRRSSNSARVHDSGVMPPVAQDTRDRG